MPFVVGHVLSCVAVTGKNNLKICSVDVGGVENLTVVTNAPNVRVDTNTVVATVGTELEVNGEQIIVRKTAVGGVMSEGMLCDCEMLGWGSGSVGNCVQVPTSFAPGDEGNSSYFVVMK